MNLFSATIDPTKRWWLPVCKKWTAKAKKIRKPYQIFSELRQPPKKVDKSVVAVIEMNPHSHREAEHDVEFFLPERGQVFGQHGLGARVGQVEMAESDVNTLSRELSPYSE